MNKRKNRKKKNNKSLEIIYMPSLTVIFENI